MGANAPVLRPKLPEVFVKFPSVGIIKRILSGVNSLDLH